ncbi:unnamed protein product, partial [Symbiodinium sp. CCMP2456]
MSNSVAGQIAVQEGVPDNADAAKRLEATHRSLVPEDLLSEKSPAASAGDTVNSESRAALVLPLDGGVPSGHAFPTLSELDGPHPILKPAGTMTTALGSQAAVRTDSEIQSAILATIEEPASSSTGWWVSRKLSASASHVPSMSISRYIKVDSQVLDTVGGILILLNSLVMLVELEMIGQRSGQLLVDPEKPAE